VQMQGAYLGRGSAQGGPQRMGAAPGQGSGSWLMVQECRGTQQQGVVRLVWMQLYLLLGGTSMHQGLCATPVGSQGTRGRSVRRPSVRLAAAMGMTQGAAGALAARVGGTMTPRWGASAGSRSAGCVSCLGTHRLTALSSSAGMVRSDAPALRLCLLPLWLCTLP
jgi:hypothetical protein